MSHSLTSDYRPIARRWRPKSFSELLGQEVICRTLTGALAMNRLPHVLLFTGSKGTGKTSTARILSKILRCTHIQKKAGREETKKELPLISPCHQCQDCLSIHSGTNPSVLEIDGASHNGVEAVRELTSHMTYSPPLGQYKIYIIDEVHMLSLSAFNALLKALEEPPPYVFFILATTEAQKIPITVLSRCQRFNFKRISMSLIVQQLEKICKEEEIKAEPKALWKIAHQSDGSLRDAQILLDQMLSFSLLKVKENKDQKSITLEDIVQVLGLTDRKLLQQALDVVTQSSSKKVLSLVSKIYETGLDPGEFIKDFLQEIRNLLFVKIIFDSPLKTMSHGEPMSSSQNLTLQNFSSLDSFSFSSSSSDQNISSLLHLPEEEISHLKERGKNMLKEDLHLLFHMALKGSEEVLKAKDSQLALEMFLLRMAEAPRIESLSLWMGGSLPSQVKKRELSFPCEENSMDL